MAFYKHIRASANGLETNDVIEDGRHWLGVTVTLPGCTSFRFVYTYIVLGLTVMLFMTVSL